MDETKEVLASMHGIATWMKERPCDGQADDDAPALRLHEGRTCRFLVEVGGLVRTGAVAVCIISWARVRV